MRPPSQRGNILFLILLAVVLFAALSYAVTSSTRGGGNDASGETAQAQAAELMNYFAQLDTAVQRMILTGGVKDYELNFFYQTNNKFVYGAADNTNCTDSRCRVFDPAGGAVNGRTFESFTHTGANAIWPRIVYSSVPSVGTAAAEILIRVEGVKANICKAVNAKSFNYNSILLAGGGTAAASIMYQNVIPTGPIAVSDTVTGTLPVEATSSMTFCACRRSTIDECTNNATYPNDPAVYHVLVAR